MKYDCFINIIRQCETDVIKSIHYPNTSCLTDIPPVFALFLSDIVKILEKNKNDFCQEDEVLAVFGMQPAGAFIRSDFPYKTKRFIHEMVPGYHFCCTFDFIATTPDQLNSIKIRSPYLSVLVDFTSGRILDKYRYVSEVCDEDLGGKIYGCLPKEKLDHAWEILISEKYTMPAGKFNAA